MNTAGGVQVLTLQRGKVNALNHGLLRELLAAMQAALADPSVSAVVITGNRPRFFSPGFDVAEVFQYDRAQIGEFLTTFGQVIDTVLWSPKPVVAGLNGQTYAGGAILALCCDFRLMAEGDFGFALTEVNIGVRLPESIYRLLAQAAGVPVARRMFLTGDPISPAEGLACGLYRALAPEAEVAAKAMEWAAYLGSKPLATYAAIKHKMLEAEGLTRMTPGSTWIDVDAWFTPEAEAMKRKLAEKLGKA